MTYQTVVLVSQIAALILFAALFAGVLAYVFWPGNRQRLDRASRIPLDGDSNNAPTGTPR
jgi:cytochrome c oxidase cbb3-type subunit 4